MEGNSRFKIDCASLKWEGNLPFLLCFTLYSRANFKYKPPTPPPPPPRGGGGGLYSEWRFNGGFFCIMTWGGGGGGVIFGGAYFWHFMVCYFPVY